MGPVVGMVVMVSVVLRPEAFPDTWRSARGYLGVTEGPNHGSGLGLLSLPSLWSEMGLMVMVLKCRLEGYTGIYICSC